MKKIAIVLIVLALAGCQAPDEEIRADIAGKAQKDLNFSGLNYIVLNGIVDFTGHCPSKKAFAAIRHTISGIHVIKAVNYHISIAPVVLDTLTSVKLLADSILSKYPQATAQVNKNGITLKGVIASAQKANLLKRHAVSEFDCDKG